jgi:hypothetical protein
VLAAGVPAVTAPPGCASSLAQAPARIASDTQELKAHDVLAKYGWPMALDYQSGRQKQSANRIPVIQVGEHARVTD